MKKNLLLLLFSVIISLNLFGQSYPFYLYGPGLDGSTNQKFALFSETQYGLLFEAPLDASGNRLPITFKWRDNAFEDWVFRIGNEGFYIHSANKITDSNGNLQVATNLPFAKDAGGQITFGGIYKDNGARAGWACIAGRKENNISGDGSSYLLFGTADNTTTITERMRIDSEGRVGIGTNNPQNTLDVNGTIHAREVKINLTGWPDFVFEPSYQLKSLTDVEEYIKINGHLEHIPSTQQVEENGINLGEMQVRLLQKIEELTLYTIEQNKKIEQQNQELKTLKEKIEKMEAISE